MKSLQKKASKIFHGTLWDDPDTRLLAFTLAGTTAEEADLHVIINMSEQQTLVELPDIKNKSWCLAIDTSEQSPQDIISPHNQKAIKKSTYLVDGKAVVAFENRKSQIARS